MARGRNRRRGGRGDDRLEGRSGDDDIFGEDGDDRIRGGGGDDRLEGGRGDDDLNGGGGDDKLDGAGGVDVLIGNGGDDSYFIDDASEVDLTRADPGEDRVYSTVTYTLGQHQERLILRGTAAIDGTGNDGDNHLEGNAAANTLSGGDGDDELKGGLGADTLLGGEGDDELKFDAADLLIDGGAGEDELEVGGAGVTIDLSNLGALTLAGIEEIDLEGSGDNTLMLTLQDLLDLSDTDVLKVEGNAGDAVQSAGQGWVLAGTDDDGGETYNVYTSGTGTLLVDLDITQTGIS